MYCTHKKLYRLIVIAYVLSCFMGFSHAGAWEKEPPGDYVERLAKGEEPGWVPPSIEELTQGKVKVGDVITSENVDLVKEYLAPSIYGTVKAGMVLRMARNYAPDKIIPKYFWEATIRNKGKGVVDENGTVRLADGAVWPGGMPFPSPKVPIEAMANAKFGKVQDDYYIPSEHQWNVGKHGNVEKGAGGKVWFAKATGRLNVPPKGVVPGHENTQWRQVVVFTYPMEMKGLGQLSIRHYDEYKDPDTGFAYLPAFKRVIRISATTYQDNVGGSDYTWGDPQGLMEPFAYWNFESMNTKLLLCPEPKCPAPWVLDNGDANSTITLDHGKAFPRMGWAITPVLEIEARPNIKHVYGKKVLYVYSPPYYGVLSIVPFMDIYDRQLALWKCFITGKDTSTTGTLQYGLTDNGFIVKDLQTGHSTLAIYKTEIDVGVDIEEIDLTKLMKVAR